MKAFKFKKFIIQQSAEVFRVGTDGVLLGALSSVETCKKILEVGSGTGLISLMLAQRNTGAEILALDINDEAVTLSEENFKNSPFSDRMSVQLQNYQNFSPAEKYDLIVSNPPYFEISPSEKDKIARQRLYLSFEDLISKSSLLLLPAGIFSVIIPVSERDSFVSMASLHNLFLIRQITVFGIAGADAKRVILEFSATEQSCVYSELIIEKSPRKYSGQYLELTKEFHVFGK